MPVAEPKIVPKRYFSGNKSTLILGIVLVLVFRCFLDKKDRLGKSTKNGRLKDCRIVSCPNVRDCK